MIKMIASDMDGTLLNDESRLSNEIIELIKELKKRNIVFVAASGRQYIGMTRFFEKVKDDIYFVAENGSFAVHKEKEIYSSVMDLKLIHEVIQEAEKTDQSEILLCGKYYTYTDNPQTKERLQMDTHKYAAKLVKSLYDVEDEIVKVSIMEKNPGKKESYKILYPLFKDKAEIVVSGMLWYDIVNQNVNKGNTIQMIQKSLGITKSETMAFGDNYNDIDMLKAACYSFVMGNAEDGVKKYGKYVIGTNNEGAVAKEIKSVLYHGNMNVYSL